MKKSILTVLAFTSLHAFAAQFPAECETYFQLNREAASLNKEVAKQMGDLGKTEKEMRESWTTMNSDEQKQAIKICQVNNEQIRKIITLLKSKK